MQPHPLAALPPVTDQLDAHLGADQVDRPEAGQESIRGLPHPESDLLGKFQRGFEGDLTDKLGRRYPRLDRA